MESERREYILEGLDCANCAQKIEDGTAKLTYVKEASVNFTQCKLTVQYKNEQDIERKEEDLKAAIQKMDEHVHVLSLHEENKSEAIKEDLKGKFISIVVAILFFGIAILAPVAEGLQIACYVVAYIAVGYEVLKTAARNILRGQFFDEYFLMSLATIGAFLIGEYPEAVAVMLFYRIGEYFQARAVNHSRKSIRALLNMKPDFATIFTEQGEQKVPPEKVQKGSVILVKPGERIALDGIIQEGGSDLDVSALTGESIPKHVTVGDEVLSGSINGSGILKIEVTANYENSTLAKILELVEHATNKKTKTENFITKFARVYTPAVVVIALILATIPPLVFADAMFSDWLYRALVFLVISCPCALVISIPLSYFAGIGILSKNGILVKGSHILEGFTQVSAVVFDKTGTLTKGKFQVISLHPEKEYTKEQLLYYAAYGEMYSNHPIAKSMLAFYKEPLQDEKVSNYEEEAGYGISLQLEGKTLLVGNEKMMLRHQIPIQKNEAIGTIVYVAYNDVFIGSILIGDQIKPDAKDAMTKLKSFGVKKTVMLTGDTTEIGEDVAAKLGLDEVHAGLLPQEKLAHIEKLYEEKLSHEKLIFVGDGMNDTPALARADIGIAMGGIGSDAAMEVADVILMNDEPSKISTAIYLSKETKKIVWQNIIFSLGVKMLFLLLGAVGIATLWEAVFADVGVTILAILNALRILRK